MLLLLLIIRKYLKTYYCGDDFMEEIWLNDKDLIKEEDWVKEINSLKSDEIEEKELLKKEIKDKLFLSVEKRWPKQRFGVFFSGGVDSSVIALISKKLGYDFTCYTIGFQEGTKLPADIEYAQKGAKKFNFDLKYKIFNLKEAEEIIEKVVKILKNQRFLGHRKSPISSVLKKVDKIDVVNVGVGAVVLAAIEMGKEDNVEFFMGGLGSEEIFAGYERHANVKDVQEECWKGLKLMWNRDLVRDFNLARSLGVSVRTPFLDAELIKVAMQVPGKWKMNKDFKKVILREVAEEMGLGEIAWRKKKAAQYGSCFDKAIGKLAKKKGFKLKKDYLQSLHV